MSPDYSSVALVSLPFYAPLASCYQIEILKKAVEKENVKVRCFHLHHIIGREMAFAGHGMFFKSLTSVRYFGDYLIMARWFTDQSEEIIKELISTVSEASSLDVDQLSDFYACFNQAVEEFLNEIKSDPPGVIGFSATHYQLIPSLYVATRVKEISPNTKIILGGYLSSIETCHDILRLHPYIDWIVYGEGERVLARLVSQLKAGKNSERGVIKGERITCLSDQPDYDQFITEIPQDVKQLDKFTFSFELSRGCYWDKCDFCNFNSAYGKFRKFNFQDVVDLMDDLYDRYGITRFQFLDTSVPPSFANFLIKNKITRPEFDIFCEIMIDFNKQQLQSLYDFGVRRAQIGIESFSNNHLKAMNKNANVMDNIICLKNCDEIGIIPVYGIIVEHPKDHPDYYDEMCEVIKNIQNLCPPRYISQCDIRPNSPLHNLLEQLNAEIKYSSGIFDRVLSPTKYNCELRPTKIIFPNYARLQKSLKRLKIKIEDWKNSYKYQISSDRKFYSESEKSTLIKNITM